MTTKCNIWSLVKSSYEKKKCYERQFETPLLYSGKIKKLKKKRKTIWGQLEKSEILTRTYMTLGDLIFVRYDNGIKNSLICWGQILKNLRVMHYNADNLF